MEHDQYASLVKLAQGGSVEAFSRLVSYFQDLAMSVAYGWLGDTDAARDVSQEAFLEAYVNLRQLREPAAFPGWLRRIVYKHCDRVTRRRRLELLSPEDDVWCAAAREEHADADDSARRLRRAVASLPPAERLVVALHYFADLTGPEVATFLEVSLPLVKKRLRRARARLREQGEDLMEMREYRPSGTEEFADVVTFFLAIRVGDHPRVKAMLAKVPELVHARQEWDPGLVTDGVLPFARRATALVTAVERNDLRLLKLLLNAGADVNGECGCATGESPVWAAPC